MRKHPSFMRFGLIVLALVTLFCTYSLTWVAQPAVASDQLYQTYSPLTSLTFPMEAELRLQVTDVDLLGMISFPTGYIYGETEVGGLSGLVYNQSNGFYTALSDDRSQTNDARFYSLTIDLDDGSLDEGDVAFAGLITIESEAEEPFAENALDPEGIALTDDFRIFISSEGNASAEPPLAPFIREFTFVGSQVAELPLPEKYLPQADGSSGIRNNLAFESLTVTPNQRYLYTAIENALVQDGSAATLEEGSPVRILQYDLASGTPIHEFVYMVDAIPQAPDPVDEFADNGLVDLQPLDDNGSFLALERSFAVSVGNTIRLYAVQTQGALDVLGIDSLQDAENFDAASDSVQKELLLDFAELGIQPDNVEGMVFGPLLTDGRQSLILVSENNFNESQSTQFIALGLSFEAIGVVSAKAETEQMLDIDPAAADLPEDTAAGTAADPAIWVHPTEPGRSLIFAALKDGGLAIMGLDGNTLATIQPDSYGAERYDNVDIIYDFELNGETRDLIVVADGANNTLAIFGFDPIERTMENVTGDAMLEAIFGDGADQTTNGLATYTDSTDGTAYVFVTQNAGSQVAQLALQEDGNDDVSAEVVRTITLPAMGPAMDGDGAAVSAHGMVVDQVSGYLYVVAADGMGILKYKAAANAGDNAKPVRMIHTDDAMSQMAGLTIYYGPSGEGYLLATVPSNSSYAVFERTGDNRYLGSFAIGDVVNEDQQIDQATGSIRIDVVNVALGGQYPSGLLVVQDSVDVGEAGAGTTNFKLVPWENVASGFAQPLMIDAESYQPR